jgi:hypothetical protein
MTWFKENGTKGSREVTMKRRERIITRTFRRSLKHRGALTQRLPCKQVLLAAATVSLFAATLAPLGLPGATALAESGNVKRCTEDFSDEGITFKSITHKNGKVNSMLNSHARCGQGFPVAGD